MALVFKIAAWWAVCAVLAVVAFRVAIRHQDRRSWQHDRHDRPHWLDVELRPANRSDRP